MPISRIFLEKTIQWLSSKLQQSSFFPEFLWTKPRTLHKNTIVETRKWSRSTRTTLALQLQALWAKYAVLQACEGKEMCY